MVCKINQLAPLELNCFSRTVVFIQLVCCKLLHQSTAMDHTDDRLAADTNYTLHNSCHTLREIPKMLSFNAATHI